MGYKNSLEFDELFGRVEDDCDVLFYNHGKVFSLLEYFSCSLLPTTFPTYTSEENEQLSSFLFSVFIQQGLTVTHLFGTSIDPIRYPPNEGKFKHSKFEPTEFILVHNENGEDESGRELLMFTTKVAATCELPWFSFVGGAFKQEVLTTIVATKESSQVPLIQVILQNRMEESVAKMSVPFFIDIFESTTTPDRKLYTFTSDSEVSCCLPNNERVWDWRKYKMR
jgi:hypothetical protein